MNYLSVEQIELRAIEQLRVAAELPPDNEKSDAIRSAMQLRSYAAMKQLFETSLTIPSAIPNA